MKEICICQCGVVAENWSTDFIYTLSPSRQKQMLKPWLLDVKLSFWTWSYQNSGYAIIIINCVIFSESTFLKQFVVFIISLKLLKNLGCQGLHIHTCRWTHHLVSIHAIVEEEWQLLPYHVVTNNQPSLLVEWLLTLCEYPILFQPAEKWEIRQY